MKYGVPPAPCRNLQSAIVQGTMLYAAESGLAPARALLNHREASFTRRLYARPRGGEGPEGILERRSSALTTRIRATAALRRHEAVEPQQRGLGRRFTGQVMIEAKEEAIVTTNRHRLAETIWTDGSWLDDKRVGAVCVWRRPVGWTGHRFHLGSNKEVFDAEVSTVYWALLELDQRQESGR